jgi:hypothetical protein
MARRFLPRSTQMQLSRPFTSGPRGNNNSISVYVQCFGPLAKPDDSLNHIRVETVDNFGEVLGNDYQSLDSAGKDGVKVFTTLSFPRRQSSFLIRFYAGTNQTFSELRVPNPIKNPFPEWNAEELPITKTNGDLSVTFKGLKKLLEVQRYNSKSQTNIYLQPEFEIRWKGAITPEWKLGSCLMEDATGNWMGGVIPGLPSHEPVWKLNTMFSRLPGSVLEPNESVSVQLLVPANGTFTPLNIETNVQGMTIWLIGWLGAGEAKLSNGVPFSAKAEHATEPYTEMVSGWTNVAPGWTNATCLETLRVGKPTLLLAHSPAGLNFQITLMFIDAEGKREEPFLNHKYFSPDRYGARSNALHRFVQPELATNTTSIYANIIVQRLREFQFYTKPPTSHTWLGRPPGQSGQ